MFLLTTPNAPYGAGFPTAWVAELLERFRGIVVADEAYIDFAEESSLPLLAASPRLIVVAHAVQGLFPGRHESGPCLCPRPPSSWR